MAIVTANLLVKVIEISSDSTAETVGKAANCKVDLALLGKVLLLDLTSFKARF